MAGKVPTVFWFDRFENRIGVLNVLGAFTHTEEINGEDTVEFDTLAAPTKGDRLVWRDAEGAWHEHIVVRTDEDLDGVCGVYAENSACEMLDDYIVDRRPRNVAASVALAAALSPTRWVVDTCADLGLASATFYHTNALAALHAVADAWGGELELGVDVVGGAVARRWVRLHSVRGGWHGARFTYGRNLVRCRKSVLEDEVCTALYGYGAGLPVEDESGSWTGGYRRRLTFGDINDGLDYVADEDAREAWGRWDAGHTAKVHSFGSVVFDKCEDKEELLALTQAALAVRKQPQVTYDVDVAMIAGGVPVNLGDEVAVVDAERKPEWRLRLRALRRVRIYAEVLDERIVLGNVESSLFSTVDEISGRLYVNEDMAGYASDQSTSNTEVAAAQELNIEELQNAVAVRPTATEMNAAIADAIAALDDLGGMEF